MSRGLGIAQRRLLCGLYAAPFQGLVRWDIRQDDEGEDRWPAARLGPADGTEFYVLAQLGLAEFHDTVVRRHSRRWKVQFSDGVATWTYLCSDPPTTSAERDLLRSWRAVYRRAADNLTARGLVETVRIGVDLEALGQQTWSRGDPPQRDTVLVRITNSGRHYVQQRRGALVDEPGNSTDDLRRALRAAGFLDIAEPLPRPSPPEQHTEQIGATRPRDQRSDPTPERVPQPNRPRGRDEVIALLVGEGFEVDRVGVVLRAWHREEQRTSRERFGDNGIPLEEWEFSPEEIDELRQRLTAS
ncbi:hypothetical protein [Nocardia brasiliensis]|uniref:hypothetical protein n=1 Tax=Nocardia brasiliensis TaxID=37326 RepID=UPI0024575E4B|nr:hypothetical protein [Nocardia brasiliensis]